MNRLASTLTLWTFLTVHSNLKGQTATVVVPLNVIPIDDEESFTDGTGKPYVPGSVKKKVGELVGQAKRSLPFVEFPVQYSSGHIKRSGGRIDFFIDRPGGLTVFFFRSLRRFTEADSVTIPAGNGALLLLSEQSQADSLVHEAWHWALKHWKAKVTDPVARMVINVAFDISVDYHRTLTWLGFGLPCFREAAADLSR